MPHRHSRREFLQSSLVCAVAAGFEEVLAAQSAPAPRYDLLIKGGRVIDPAQALSDQRDVAVAGGKIARLDRDIPAREARQVLDARGKIVAPGLIDVHVHVYDGVAPLGIPADPNCIAKGVTTVLDAGSAGAHTFPGLRILSNGSVVTMGPMLERSGRMPSPLLPAAAALLVLVLCIGAWALGRNGRAAAGWPAPAVAVVLAALVLAGRVGARPASSSRPAAPARAAAPATRRCQTVRPGPGSARRPAPARRTRRCGRRSSGRGSAASPPG